MDRYVITSSFNFKGDTFWDAQPLKADGLAQRAYRTYATMMTMLTA